MWIVIYSCSQHRIGRLFATHAQARTFAAEIDRRELPVEICWPL